MILHVYCFHASQTPAQQFISVDKYAIIVCTLVSRFYESCVLYFMSTYRKHSNHTVDSLIEAIYTYLMFYQRQEGHSKSICFSIFIDCCYELYSRVCPFNKLTFMYKLYIYKCMSFFPLLKLLCYDSHHC